MDWIRQSHLKFAAANTEKQAEADILIWGLPTDCGAGSDKKGAFKGPAEIRKASRIWNTVRTSHGIAFDRQSKIMDLGDLELSGLDSEAVFSRISQACPSFQNQLLVSLGGDHSITMPLLKSSQSKWALIYFDAHPDAVEHINKNRLSHACTLKRLFEWGCLDAEHSVLLGIRIPEAEEVLFLKEKGFQVITAFDILKQGVESVSQSVLQTIAGKPVYMSIDLDVLDAACVPGVENPEPGGLSSRELLYLCQCFAPYIKACDLVEVTGDYDPAGITAKTAARVLLDIMGSYIQHKSNQIT